MAKTWCRELDIFVYIYILYIVTLSIIIWIFFIDRQHQKSCSYIDLSSVTTEICWYFHYSCCSKHLTSHACALLIDNVGNYLYMYLNNGSFKSEVDPHQFNLREKKKIFKSWQVCDWLAKWLIVLGFMDLRWPRVYRRSNVGLVYNAIKIFHFFAGSVSTIAVHGPIAERVCFITNDLLVSTIRRTKYQNVHASRLILQLSLPIHWSQVLSRE